MEDLIAFSITVFTGFFAIMNPIANLPVNLSLLQGANNETKQRINRKATVTAFFIVTVFVILGKIIFQLFGLTIPAFEITGGILIFLIGVDMLQSKNSRAKNLKEVKINEDIAISPLATPLLAGPGSIVTAMNFVANETWIFMGMVIVIFGVVCYLNYLAFSMGELIIKKIGYNIIAVVGKIMGLIIAIIGTGMVLKGIKIAFNFL